ncbi:MAG: HAMP domain-containing histidine kinase [Phaeodactylibacter sp.]|nr:HAMP domain-containing histidine kinase [Phaeodactylibacter sp.]MCB9276437.1 HAMP domain-containing histidine kinase [Lewinellaceae bacterium]
MNWKSLAASSRLFWKISAAFLLVLALLGVGYILITSYTAGRYLQEVNQRLYGGIARQLVKETQPLVDGKPDTAATHDIMHSMMVINPSVEVYLLDPFGKIIDYVVPNKSVHLQRVSIQPIKKFITDEGRSFVLGDDPRNPGARKAFSAAPIIEDGNLAGYAYIILASEEQAAVTSSLFGSYILQLGAKTFFLALLAALAVGLIAIGFITKNLRLIIDTTRRFKEGDYQARIPEDGRSDLAILAVTFNDMADKIEANIEQIQSMGQLRQELIANVSHDLRTPLSIVQGYIETLLMKEEQLPPEERRKYLEIIYDSSEKLSRLIVQLFEYSKLETNQIQPEKEPFPLSELAQDVFAKYQILAREKGLVLKLEHPRELPLVFADLGLVERVIQNLMDNALKFTPEGGKVTLQLRNREEGVEVRISDTGPGIPESEQSHIFERYRKAGGGNERNKGAGLGLAIVKKILEIHNATIQVQSRQGQGAAFSFWLPAYQG